MKQANAMNVLASTTGAGVVIGTNCDLGSILVGSAATTVTIVANGTAVISVITSINLPTPAGLNGPVTATSSGGTFSILYRNRNS